MEKYLEEKDLLQFKDLHEKIQDQLGSEPWVPIYVSNKDEYQSTNILAALLPKEMAEEAIENADWDILYADGTPGIITYFKDGEEDSEYFRYGNDEGIEPLVILRDFHGLRKSSRECAEEFRLYFNLYFNEREGKYEFLDWDGNEIDAVGITGDGSILVSLRFIKHYAFIKGMCLAIYFEIDRISERNLEEVGLADTKEEFRGEDYHYYVYTGEKNRFSEEGGILARLHGKKIVKGVEHRELEYVEKAEREHVSFVIGVDEDGNDIEFTCNENMLANNFGLNPESPHYLTLVHFKKEVLKKYYDNSEKYTVEDQYLRCGGLWGLRMDNHGDKNVVVFLGDLGGLGYQEQLYWRSFNIHPIGGISKVAFKRDFMAEFADPEKADLLFKMKLRNFYDKWTERNGWPLFKPLSEADKHALIALHVPPDDNQQEFDQQVAFLSKILVESINTAEINKKIELHEGEGGITKLGRFLVVKGMEAQQGDAITVFLKRLHDVNNGTRHRKGRDYERGMEYFRTPRGSLSTVFEIMLLRAIQMLEQLNGLLS